MLFRFLQQPYPTKISFLLIPYFVHPYFMCKISIFSLNIKIHIYHQKAMRKMNVISFILFYFNWMTKYPLSQSQCEMTKKYHFETRLV